MKSGITNAESLDNMRIPLKYLANLLAAGDEKPVRRALERLLAMRAFIRSERFAQNKASDQSGDKLAGQDDFAANTLADPSARASEESIKALEAQGLDPETARAMYRMLALARLEDRFVVPSTRRELADNVDKLKGEAGFPEAIS